MHNSRTSQNCIPVTTAMEVLALKEKESQQFYLHRWWNLYLQIEEINGFLVKERSKSFPLVCCAIHTKHNILSLKKKVHYYFSICCPVLFNISPFRNNLKTDITRQHLEVSSGYRNFNLILSTSPAAQRKKV